MRLSVHRHLSCAIPLCLPFRGGLYVSTRKPAALPALGVEKAHVISAHTPSVFLTAGP